MPPRRKDHRRRRSVCSFIWASAKRHWAYRRALSNTAFLAQAGSWIPCSSNGRPVDFSDWDIERLCRWCDGHRNSETGAVEVLDLVKEPVWRADLKSANSHWISSVIRALGWNRHRIRPFKIRLADDHLQMVERLIPKIKLAAGLPGP